MEVRVWSYLEQLSNEKNDINLAIQSVLDSGVLILGENVKKFEEEFSSYCNSKFGVGVNSATDALFLALKAMKIEKGDEIITVSNTAVPTVSAIVAAGGIPVFVDIHEESYLMDINEVEKSINNKTKGIYIERGVLREDFLRRNKLMPVNIYRGEQLRYDDKSVDLETKL